jgi:hypothetical protein
MHHAQVHADAEFVAESLLLLAVPLGSDSKETIQDHLETLGLRKAGTLQAGRPLMDLQAYLASDDARAGSLQRNSGTA